MEYQLKEVKANTSEQLEEAKKQMEQYFSSVYVN